MFKEKLYVGRPNIGNRENFLNRINQILDHRWFTNDGPYIRELELKLAQFLGVKHCIAICNGTIALEIAIRAIGMRGEVIIPSFTFIATAHALQWQGITPVFADIETNSHHINIESIERLITPQTTGIIGVHVWGTPCNTAAIQDIADHHDLHILYDAAHAFGCSYNNRMIGTFGDAEVFSFHATKFYNTFEGGAITTNNDQLAQKARFMRNFGFAGYDDVQYVGTNGKMTEVSAAMGLTLLESLDEIIEVNFRHYQYYQEVFKDIAGVNLYVHNPKEKNNYQYIIVEVDENIAGISRDNLVKILQAENVIVRRYFYPGCHQMEPYRSQFPHLDSSLPNTNLLVSRVMSLPTGTAVSESDIEKIGELVRFSVIHSNEITHELLHHGG